MIKGIGAVMVILAGGGWGMLQAAKIEECYRQMRYLRKLIFRIRSEIRYSRQVLPEAFLHVGSEAQEPYKMWLLSLCERLTKRGYKSGGNMGRRDEKISCGNRNPTGYDGESDTPGQ